MRNINWIVLHCTAGPQTQTVQSILNWWKNGLGWKTPGYHFLIEPNGNFHELVPIEQPSNGVKGFNEDSIHISYIGGVKDGKPVDNRTEKQRQRMEDLVELLSLQFPNAVIQGHRDFSPDKNRDGIISPDEWFKTCPSFSVKEWLKEIGFENKMPAPLFMKTTTKVNLRSGRGTTFSILTTLDTGTEVKVLSEIGSWSYVSVNCSNQLGWLSSRYIK